MRRYRRFLRELLAVNLIFILAVAFLGYRKEHHELAQVSGRLEAKGTEQESIDEDQVIPVGKTVGIYVNTQGILVIDTGEVTDLEGKRRTPAKNKLLTGDYITMLNGENIKTKKQLIDRITSCGGQELVFGIRRGGKDTTVSIHPVETDPGIYKVGIWVRDDLQGLGTVTYLAGKRFGALGHSINDSDTGTLLEVSAGEIYDADIFGVEKGLIGNPGEIEGMIEYQTERVVGNIEENRLYGIYGTVSDGFCEEVQEEQPVRIAAKEEVRTGTACIQSYVSGQRKLYEIQITGIHRNQNGDPEFEFIVTDDNLLSLTGGIIQGMSGSPVLQDGKLAGAVTHVFVDDPKRGYGIFVETMRKQDMQS